MGFEYENNTLFITEYDDDFNETGFMELKFSSNDNSSLSGKWLNKTKTKSFPVKLKK